MRRASRPRALRRAVLVGLIAGCSGASACADNFDTTPIKTAQLSLGDELYGVLCDRVAATADPADLEGRKSRRVCHADDAGTYQSDYADADKPMPPKVGVMVKYRTSLVSAFNSIFPDTKYPGDAPGAPQGLHHDVQDLLKALVPLYDDDTIPESTRNLASIFDEVAGIDNTDTDAAKKAAAAARALDTRKALARLGGRKGYRTIATALGVARPLLAYPHITDVVDTTIKLLGPGGTAEQELHKVLEVSQAELSTATIPSARLPISGYVDRFGAVNGQKPKLTSEILKNLLLDPPPLTADLSKSAYPAGWTAPFANDGAGGTAPYLPILHRDPRGYAAFVTFPSAARDTSGSGLPDVDDTGRFLSKTGGPLVVPNPFAVVDTLGGPGDTAKRDPQGRAIDGSGNPIYVYRDASSTFLHAALVDSKALAVPSNDALLDLLHAIRFQLGPRSAATGSNPTVGPDSRAYPAIDGTSGTTTVQYRKYDASKAPLTDLIYALGQTLTLPKMGDYLELLRQLTRDHPNETARLLGAIWQIRAVANDPAYASISLDPKSGFWDDMIGVVQQIAAEPDLLLDVIEATADDNLLKLAPAMGNFAANKDALDYNPDADGSNPGAINDPVFDLSAGGKSATPTIPTDLTASDTGANRSLLQRFAALISDASGVVACNKDGAKVDTGILGISLPLFGGHYNPCDVFRIDDVSKFYLGCVANPGSCTMPLTDGFLKTLSGIGLVDPILEGQSGITGLKTHPTIAALNRFVMWRKPSQMIADLTDPVPSVACPIVDPAKGVRKCASPNDTLQIRDRATIFMGEELDSLAGLAPLVRPFTVARGADKTDRLNLLLALFSTMNKHWSPGAADSFACDKSAAPGSANYCTGSNIRQYEQIISKAIASDVLPALNVLTKTAKGLKIHGQSGTQVMVSLAADLIGSSTAKAMGLKNRDGSVGTTTNDGRPIDQVTLFYLFANALNRMDAQWVGADGIAAHALWKSARSKLVDQFVSVDAPGGDFSKSVFHDQAVQAATPILIDILQDRIDQHTAAGDLATWATSTLPKSFVDSASGPLFASTLDLMDKIYVDPTARKQVANLLVYMMDKASQNDAFATLTTSAGDILQLIGDDANMVPLYHAFAVAAAPDGAMKRGLDLLERAKDVETDPSFASAHGNRRVLTTLLANAVTPMGTGKAAPIEVLIDCIADLHRADPTASGPFTADDYGSVASQVEDFLTSNTRGMEQLYAIVKNRNP